VVVDRFEPSTLESNGFEHETSVATATSARTSARASKRRSARRHDAVAEAPTMPCIIAVSIRKSASALRAPTRPKSGIAPEACVSGRNRTTRQRLHKISVDRSCGVRKDAANTATPGPLVPSLYVPCDRSRLCDGRVGGLASSWRAETRDGRAQAQLRAVGSRALSIASLAASMRRASVCWMPQSSSSPG
jgi:hypothetical protein